MGRDPRNASSCRIALKQLPNHLLAQADRLRLAAAVHWPKHETVSNSGGGSPRILRYLYPCRHGNRPHPSVLTHEVHDAPSAIALLDVAHGQRRHLGASQSAAQEHRQDRAVPQPLGGGYIWRV
jgi:hypothetical protein